MIQWSLCKNHPVRVAEKGASPQCPLLIVTGDKKAKEAKSLRLDYGGLGLVWQNCNISVIYHWI